MLGAEGGMKRGIREKKWRGGNNKEAEVMKSKQVIRQFGIITAN